MDVNELVAKKTKWLACYHGNKASRYTWFPIARTGKYAITDLEYEVKAYLNPSPITQEKMFLSKDPDKARETLQKQVDEARWIKWRMPADRVYPSLKEYQRYLRLALLLKFTGNFEPLPSSFDKHFLELIAKGLSVKASCKLLKIHPARIFKYLRTYPEFKLEVDRAGMLHQERLINALDEIGLNGESEANRLNAIKFHLERKYRNYSQKQILSTDDNQSPMSLLLGDLDEDTDDDE